MVRQKQKKSQKNSKTSLVNPTIKESKKKNLKRKFVFDFEGIDGAGKTSLIKKIFEILSPDYEINLESEPVDKRIESIKENNALLISLFIADRYFHVQKIKNSFYDIILLDRYIYSTLVYQGLEASRGELTFIKKAQESFPRPDLIFYIDTPPHVCLQRKKDLYSLSQLTLFKKMYDFIFQKNTRVVKIDGTLPMEIQASQIIKSIKKTIK